MGFRVRRSVQIAPGVRFNVSKTGVGLGFGPRGMRYTVHSSGRRTTTVRSGVPGLYYQSQRGGGRRAPARSTAAPHAARPSTTKPGLFAPRAEKDLYRAIKEQASPAVIAQIGEAHPEYRVLTHSLAGLLLSNSEDLDEPIRLLSSAFKGPGDARTHPFAQKYLHADVQIHIATGVTVHLPIGRDAVGLALAEAYQQQGKLEEAIDIVEQLEPTTYAAVSLADLYTEAKRYSEVVELTDGVTNEDDSTMLLLILRGIALREQDLYEAAQLSFKEALRFRSRPAELRHLALFERSQTLARQGKRAQARKDLERIIAEDSKYPGVQQQLAELA
jgi:tetratricopeptide (TPR) repeat protein